MPLAQLPPDQSASLERLVARVERHERRTVTPADESTLWIVTGQVTLTGFGTGSVSVSFDPVVYPVKPMLVTGLEGDASDITTATTAGIALTAWTTSGSTYTGATLKVWRGGGGAGTSWTFDWTVMGFV